MRLACGGLESAGSTPGPACYGRGGTRPTITHTMAAQNLIGHGDLGYGAVTVDDAAARAAIQPLAARLGVPVEEVAGHIVDISALSMYAEVSRFGIDPPALYLFALGGAGGMLACYLARELDMKAEIIRRFGPRPSWTGSGRSWTRREAQVRRILATIPDGDYFFAD